MKLKFAGILFSVAFAFTAQAADDTPLAYYSDADESMLDSIAVKPLIKTHWSDSSEPAGGYGSETIALAQLLNFYQVPAVGPTAERTVYVEPKIEYGEKLGEEQRRMAGGTLEGGALDWAEIAREGSNAQTQFLSDVSIALSTSFKTTGSESHISDVARALYDIYHFTNVWYCAENADAEWPLKAIAANLEVTNSVVLALANKNAKEEITARRTVLADGYGFKGDTLYVHLNMGLGGTDDGWYKLPIATNGYNMIEASVINVNPFADNDLLAVLSGRVIDERGSPLAGAKIEARWQTESLSSGRREIINHVVFATTGDAGTWGLVMTNRQGGAAMSYEVLVTHPTSPLTESLGTISLGPSTDTRNRQRVFRTIATSKDEDDEKKVTWTATNSVPQVSARNSPANNFVTYLLRDPTVRIIRDEGATTNEFTSLDRALAVAQANDMLDVFALTSLDKSTTIASDCTIRTVGAPAAELVVTGVKDSALTIAPDVRVLFQDLALTNETMGAVVKVEAGGTSALKGDLALSLSTKDAAGIEVAGAITNIFSGILVKSPNAKRAEQFGTWTCEESAKTTAIAIANADDPLLFGSFYGNGVLAWDHPVDNTTRIARYYDVNGEEVGVGFAYLDDFLQDLVELRRLNGGGKLMLVKEVPSNLFTRQFKLTEPLTIYSELEQPFCYPITPDLRAGFEIAEGGSLVLSNVTFQGQANIKYREAIFVVDGGELVLESGALVKEFAIEQGFRETPAGRVKTGNYGPIAMFDGTTTIRPDAAIMDCHANAGYGGGIYVEQGILNLEGGTIQSCTAMNGGKGIYVGYNASMFVSGCPNVSGLEMACGPIKIVAPLEPGARIGYTEAAVGVGDAIAIPVDGVELTPEQTTALANAFSNEADNGLRPEWSDEVNSLVWVESPIVPDPAWPIHVIYPDGTVVTNRDLATAFAEMTGDCTVELCAGQELWSKIEVPYSVTIRADNSEHTISYGDASSLLIGKGASLVVSNLTLTCAIVCTDPLFDIQGGALTLEKGAVVRNYLGNRREASAVFVDEGGSFTMLDGASLERCRNQKIDPAAGINSGAGGAVLVEKGSTATFLGGTIVGSGSSAPDGGAVAILGQSKAYIAGNFKADHFIVEDKSKLYLAAPLADEAKIGCTIGFMADTNLVAYVENWADKWASGEALATDAAKFFNDVDSSIKGAVVTNATDIALVVWSTALDENGVYAFVDENQQPQVYGLLAMPSQPESPVWEVVTNYPTPIAFKSIDRLSETEWSLVITDRVEFCNYRLLSTDDLAKGFTVTGDWEQAHSAGAWTTNVITTGGAWFWRAEGVEGTNMVLQVEN